MEARTVTIVGCGVIGQGWAVSFVRAGWTVTFFDAEPSVAQNAIEACRRIVRRETDANANSQHAQLETGIGRLQVANSLKEACAESDLVIEAVPERLDIKHKVLGDLDAVTHPNVVIASSTSALLPTALAGALKRQERFIVAHPFNPSYLIPLVELVPCPATSSTYLDSLTVMLEAIGLRPVQLRREIEGFIGNRLQAAVINEAMYLVEAGIASPEVVDACVSECLALRWAFYGPFGTMDLNAPNGFADYAAKFGSAYADLGRQLQTGRTWQPEAIASIADALAIRSAGRSREETFAIRDRALRALSALKTHLAAQGS